MKWIENKRIQMLFCVLSLVLIWGVYAVMLPFVRKASEKDKAIEVMAEFDSNMFVGIDKISNSSDGFIISGWVLKRDAIITDVKVVLKDVVGTKTVVIETEEKKNDNLNRYIEYLEIDGQHLEGGFSTEIKRKKLQEDTCYEIFLYLHYEEIEGNNGNFEKRENAKKISTAQYMYNGRLYGYNPKVFVSPVFVDEQMEVVINEGVLCTYSENNGFWMYLFEDKLYWILDKSIGKNADENPHMFFQINTSRIDKLPEHRKQYTFDNKDFFFNSNEILLEEKSAYRVARLPLPDEYPVTYVATGHYTEAGELWRVRFRMPIWRVDFLN